MAAWFIDALPYSRFEILSREKTFANFASRQQFVTAVLSAKIRTLNRRGTLKIVQTSYELFFATGKLAQIWCFHDAQFVMPVFLPIASILPKSRQRRVVLSHYARE